MLTLAIIIVGYQTYRLAAAEESMWFNEGLFSSWTSKGGKRALLNNAMGTGNKYFPDQLKNDNVKRQLLLIYGSKKLLEELYILKAMRRPMDLIVKVLIIKQELNGAERP
jgi:hypothetical protein